MPISRALAAGLAAAALSGPALAVEERHFALETAADLGQLCGAEPGERNFAAAIHFCHGYLTGTYQFHEALARALEDPLYCIDAAAIPDRDAAAADFAAWIAANAEPAAMRPLGGLLSWALARFPCE